MPEKLTLSVEEMGQRLGISRPLAYELIRKPGFPALRIGRRVVIPFDGLNRWIRENSGEAEAAAAHGR